MISPFDAAGPLGHVIEIVGREGCLDAGQRQDLPLLGGDDARDILGVVPNLTGDSAQDLGAFNRRTP
jgi:hypothetical protein